jgi:hypothetical protein
MTFVVIMFALLNPLKHHINIFSTYRGYNNINSFMFYNIPLEATLVPSK